MSEEGPAVAGEAEHTLHASETLFRALVESAPDGIVITDQDGRIALVNSQTEALFGYRREELLGQAVEILIPERFRHGHVGLRRGYAGQPHTRPMGEGLELYGRRRNGEEFPVSISLSPIHDDAETRIFCDIRDITARHAAEQRIQELNAHLARQNAELLALNQELEAFSYSVSHDLRAPLRAIDGFSRILLRENAAQLDAPGQDRLTRVRLAAQKMGTLIDTLLKLSRVTRAELQIQAVDLSALASEIIEELRKQEPDHPVEFSAPEGMTAHCDPRFARIALDNLLRNAWKFSARRADARIEFVSGGQRGETVYTVRDNGAGFDMAYADRLFGAFQRLHDAHDFPGIGIGLATVQRIVRKHGGRIWAEGAVDGGASFHFTLGPSSGEPAS